jgi:putative Ca2+/H+ antiporter (TMEM165/GDT1 family)
MSIRALLQAFVTVLPAELPDKTMIATIVLVTRYHQPLQVWLGAVSAFTVHVVVAVAAGAALALLPETPVQIGVAAMFLVGAALLLRSALTADELSEGPAVVPSARGAIAGSFLLIVLAEWGDLTQLATASLAAKSGEPVSTGLGALAALAAVAAIAARFGRALVARVSIQKVNFVGAAVFAALAVWTIVELI